MMKLGGAISNRQFMKFTVLSAVQIVDEVDHVDGVINSRCDEVDGAISSDQQQIVDEVDGAISSTDMKNDGAISSRQLMEFTVLSAVECIVEECAISKFSRASRRVLSVYSRTHAFKIRTMPFIDEEEKVNKTRIILQLEQSLN